MMPVRGESVVVLVVVLVILAEDVVVRDVRADTAQERGAALDDVRDAGRRTA
ncbi:hypothetical protein HEP84_47510 [Streptomyces sp. RLB1-33]|nr:hypothetical protein [Streptomyces sp. RLB1-33]QIY75543.1 hypothetical protein HEP84_47510 [Streptomyces sp. RLB1-33]